MKEPLASPVASCPECGQLQAALDEALGQLDEARKQIADLQAEIHELRSQLNRNSSNSSSPPSVDPPGVPNRSSRHRRDVSQADSRGILDTIAIASRPSGSTRSCRTCLRSAPTAKLPCPRKPRPVTPSRPGIRLPNSPSWRPTSPNTKDTHAPALAVATSIVARSHRRFAPMSSGHAWPR